MIQSGMVFDIRHFSVNDGPGIRTSVFLKGCPLRCAWCHNPESFHCFAEEVTRIQRVGENNFEYRETIGKKMTVNEVLAEIKKQQIFFDESRGGVTFSGGEPLLQHEFLLELLNACKRIGIHTVVDTSGFADLKVMEKMSDFTDLFLYDIKLIDSELHKKYTGVSNEIIHQNLQFLLSKRKKVEIRIPIIPSITDSQENIELLKQFLTAIPISVPITLLPYHKAAIHKYEQLNRVYFDTNIPQSTQNQIDNLKKELSFRT